MSVSVSEKGKVLSVRDMAGAFLAGGSAALIAAFTAIPLPGAETGFAPAGPEQQRRMARGNYFASRCKAGPPTSAPAAENSWPRAIANRLRAACFCRPAPPADRRSGRPPRGSFLPAARHTAARSEQPFLLPARHRVNRNDAGSPLRIERR